MSDRYPYREPKERQALRPFPSPCLHCRYKPARRHKMYPKWATAFCSNACRDNHHNQRIRERQRVLAERIRYHLGLPSGRGAQFTLPELEHIERRVKRLASQERKAPDRREVVSQVEPAQEWPPRKEDVPCCRAHRDSLGRLQPGWCGPDCTRRPKVVV